MAKNDVLNFEDVMQELEEVLKKISDENIGLNESIELYAKAAQLLKSSNTTLNAAQIRVDEIDKSLLDLENE